MAVHVYVGAVHRNHGPIAGRRGRRIAGNQRVLYLRGHKGALLGTLGLLDCLLDSDRLSLLQEAGQARLSVAVGAAQVLGHLVQLKNGFAQVQRHQVIT